MVLQRSSQKHQRGPVALCYRRPSAHPKDHGCFPFQSTRNPSLTPIKNTNPLTFALAPFSVTVCNGQIGANLPVASCLSFSFFLSPQIHIDIPRTNPLIPLFQQASVQEVRSHLQEHTHHLTLGGFSLLPSVAESMFMKNQKNRLA